MISFVQFKITRFYALTCGDISILGYERYSYYFFFANINLSGTLDSGIVDPDVMHRYKPELFAKSV